MQIQLLQGMGCTGTEIAAYYASGGDAKAMMAMLEARMHLLERGMEELRMRAGPGPDMSVQRVRLPGTICRVHRAVGLSVQDRYDATYDFYHACVREGCRLAPEPLFLVNEWEGYLEGRLPDAPHPFYVCVPVLPREGEEVEAFPACQALSVLYHGPYSGLPGAWLRLGEEVRARGLRPVGHLRGIAIVAPYVGQEIDPRRYCSRIAVPVEEA